MKKYIISLVVIIAFAGYVFLLKKNQTSTTATTPSASVSIGDTPATTPSAGNGTPGTPSIATQGQYKDGTFTGAVTDAYFGNLQVQAVISGGKISDVVFLQYPNDRGESKQINTEAIPVLKQEAITSQSSNVKIVSGATQSSQAFQQSLASALALAK
jgi:uncharacterized protein with FMN-binding domain